MYLYTLLKIFLLVVKNFANHVCECLSNCYIDTNLSFPSRFDKNKNELSNR